MPMATCRGRSPCRWARSRRKLPAFLQKVAVEKTLVAYCNGYGCPDSFDLGLRLIREGYRDVRVYEGGLPEWRDAGLPVVKGQP